MRAWSSAARNEASPQPAGSDLLSRQSSQGRLIGPGCGSREALPLGHTNLRRQMIGAAPSALLGTVEGGWTGLGTSARFYLCDVATSAPPAVGRQSPCLTQVRSPRWGS